MGVRSCSHSDEKVESCASALSFGLKRT